MTFILFRKLLRDVRIGLIVVALLLAAFQCLWARVTSTLSGRILPLVGEHLPIPALREIVFQGPGKIIQTLMGGESIDLTRTLHTLTIGYVHPLTIAILCVWAVGRAAGAIAGEIDRGTMELLLAQPIRRSQVLLAHGLVDLATIPVLCLSMWAGTWVGAWLLGFLDAASPDQRVDPWCFAPGLVNVALLLFAVSGFTMWISAAGRFRGRVLGLAVLLFLVQFLINVIGQLWDAAEICRPLTVFYYYQPQPIILDPHWAQQRDVWLHLGVLAGVGSVGYVLAWWTFCKRDLPAPL